MQNKSDDINKKLNIGNKTTNAKSLSLSVIMNIK